MPRVQWQCNVYPSTSRRVWCPACPAFSQPKMFQLHYLLTTPRPSSGGFAKCAVSKQLERVISYPIHGDPLPSPRGRSLLSVAVPVGSHRNLDHTFPLSSAMPCESSSNLRPPRLSLRRPLSRGIPKSGFIWKFDKNPRHKHEPKSPVWNLTSLCLYCAASSTRKGNWTCAPVKLLLPYIHRQNHHCNG
jgi:hypothetical protein